MPPSDRVINRYLPYLHTGKWGKWQLKCGNDCSWNVSYANLLLTNIIIVIIINTRTMIIIKAFNITKLFTARLSTLTDAKRQHFSVVCVSGCSIWCGPWNDIAIIIDNLHVSNHYFTDTVYDIFITCQQHLFCANSCRSCIELNSAMSIMRQRMKWLQPQWLTDRPITGRL